MTPRNFSNDTSTVDSLGRITGRAALAAIAISVMFAVSKSISTAHQVTVSEDVGGTLHIEPNDVPRAGQSHLTWFALAQRGGQPIPLSACGCALTVYQPFADEAMAIPQLTPVTAGGYRGIPSADLTFPHPGQYELVLTGYPLEENAFEPFVLRFDVTVAR